jgi:hypothetical protein
VWVTLEPYLYNGWLIAKEPATLGCAQYCELPIQADNSARQPLVQVLNDCRATVGLALAVLLRLTGP